MQRGFLPQAVRARTADRGLLECEPCDLPSGGPPCSSSRRPAPVAGGGGSVRRCPAARVRCGALRRLLPREDDARRLFPLTGGPGVEIVALDRVVSDGPWAGSRTRLVDDLNLGKYLFEVIDRRTNRVIYSRGFASIYGEWETTPECAAGRTGRSTSRCAFRGRARPVQVVLKVRDAENSFHENLVDRRGPRFPLRQPGRPAAGGRSVGAPGERPAGREGRPARDRAKGSPRRSCRSSTRTPGGWSNPCSRKSRSAAGGRTSTVWGLDLPSAASGVTRPARDGVPAQRRCRSEYNIFDSERYLLTLRQPGPPRRGVRRTVRIPRDRGERGAVRRGRHLQLPGDGRRRHGVCRIRVRTRVRPSLRRLADEYYTSDVAYETGRRVPIPSRGSRTSRRSTTPSS